ncbi:hypothetical protein KEM56_007175, partial [Ascosphaera pollenicola]
SGNDDSHPASADTPLISFPWVLHGTLCEIATGRVDNGSRSPTSVHKSVVRHGTECEEQRRDNLSPSDSQMTPSTYNHETWERNAINENGQPHSNGIVKGGDEHRSLKSSSAHKPTPESSLILKTESSIVPAAHTTSSENSGVKLVPDITQDTDEEDIMEDPAMVHSLSKKLDGLLGL